MGKTIIYYGDLIPGATLTASTEVTGYEKEFLQDYSPSNLWQSSADPSTMAVDLGATGIHQAAIWVGGSNMVAADTTYTYTTGAAAPAATNVYTLDKQTNSFSEIGDTLRYGLLDINKAAGNGEAGKIYLAEHKLELPKDIKRGYTGGTISEYIVNRGRFGQIHRELQYSKVIYSFDIAGMGDVQKEIIDETIRKEEYVIFWDGETQQAYYGVISFGQPEFIKSDISGAIWNISGTFEEAL